jgi:DNA-binding response OmpR family regulator
MSFVYAVVSDLFFGDRIGTALQRLGYRAEVIDLSEGAVPTLSQEIDLLLVDLEGGSPSLEAIQAARTLGKPVLAFGPHTDLALRAAALAAGADLVVAKSKLTTSFAELVQASLERGH